MVESLAQSSSKSLSACMASPSFASSSDDEKNDELLEMRIAETRAQLQALREEGCRQRLEHAHHYQTLQSNVDTLQHTLTKSSSRLNMFAYTHAMLQAQTTVVQPYILKKQALLCHAFHHNEVLTKQIHLRQRHADVLVTVLEQATTQIVEFWQARLSHLQRDVHHARDDVGAWRDRLEWLPHTTTSSSSGLRQEVIMEEEDEEEEYDDDDNMSSSTSSSSQWTEEASPPPQHHQQDVLLHVLSMALTAVSEGRLPSVFDPTRTTTTSSSAPKTTTKPKQLDDNEWDETSTLRRSLVGLETF